MKRNTTPMGSDSTFRGLAFSEKFTTLHKVIANTLAISKPVKNIRAKHIPKAITLLNFISGQNNQL